MQKSLKVTRWPVRALQTYKFPVVTCS